MKNIPPGKVFVFPSYDDVRGSLTCIDSINDCLPFEAKRVFWIYGADNDTVRGEHAHRTCEEIIVALRGHVIVELTDGSSCLSYCLEKPDTGLYIPAMCWCRFSEFSDDCVLLCLASEVYKADGYINSFDDFLLEMKKTLTND